MAWWKCYECKHLFVIPDNAEKRLKKCPVCGSEQIRKEEDYYDFNEAKFKCPKCGSDNVKKMKKKK